MLLASAKHWFKINSCLLVTLKFFSCSVFVGGLLLIGNVTHLLSLLKQVVK